MERHKSIIKNVLLLRGLLLRIHIDMDYDFYERRGGLLCCENKLQLQFLKVINLLNQI